METILINSVGRARQATRNGRQYLVAPLVMLVEAVLNGSKGALFYPRDEIAKSADRWNDVPIVVNHPTHNGTQVSGRQTKVLDERKIGRVYNSRFDESGRLSAEGWFDQEATRRVEPRILQALQSGRQIELSTGLYTDNTPDKGVFNGKPYDYVARGYSADHLAILPDAAGACSIADGCGINVNAESRGIVERFFAWLGGVTKQQATWAIPAKEIEFVKLESGGTNNEEQTMKLSPEQKAATVKHLTANCDCWRGEEATLNGFSDDKLAALKAHADTERARADVLAAVQNRYGVDLLTTNADEALMAKCKELMAEKPAANVQQQVPPAKAPATDAEWLSTAPPGIQSAVRNAMAIEQRERVALVQRLVVNVADTDKPRMSQRLMAKPIDELRDLASLLPAAVENTADPFQPNYFGAAGGPAANVKDDSDNILPIPTFNFDDMASPALRKKA